MLAFRYWYRLLLAGLVGDLAEQGRVWNKAGMQLGSVANSQYGGLFL